LRTTSGDLATGFAASIDSAPVRACKQRGLSLRRSIDTKPNETEVCKFSINGSDPLYLWNCSDQQLATCEAFFCLDGCTWSTGTCP